MHYFRAVENGGETITVEEDGVLKSKTVNGVVVPIAPEPAPCTDDTTPSSAASVITDPLLNPKTGLSDHQTVDIANQLIQISLNHDA